MPYIPTYSELLTKKLAKLKKKNRKLYSIIRKKIIEVLENPEHFKELRNVMKGTRRVHIMKSFVLIYQIEGKYIKFMDFDHHDNIYRKR